MADDPYRVLGLTSDASGDAIKRAYRKLAMEHHPDKNPGDQASEETFKRVSEAYGILSDPDKRRTYDLYGTSNGEASLDDLLTQMFAGSFVFMDRQEQPSSTVHEHPPDSVDVELSLVEVVHGTTKRVEFELLQACDGCGGTGAKAPSDVVPCASCGGRGVLIRAFGPLVQHTTCGDCAGRGRRIKDVERRCARCQGGRTQYIPRTFELKIPAGVPNGYEMTLAGQGAYDDARGACRDISFRFRHVAEPPYTVDDNGLDVRMRLSVSLDELLGGFSKVVEALGEPLVVHSCGYFDPTATHPRLTGGGLLDVSTQRRGDLSVSFDVVYPPCLDLDAVREQARKDMVNVDPRLRCLNVQQQRSSDRPATSPPPA